MKQKLENTFALLSRKYLKIGFENVWLSSVKIINKELYGNLMLKFLY